MPDRETPVRAHQAPRTFVTRRWRRRLRILAVITAALLLVYPVVGNLLLGTDPGRRLIQPRSERIDLTWDRAWTVLPGLVHVSNLKLDVDNRSLAWELASDTAHVWVDLLSLPSREFSILWAQVNGFSCVFETPAADDGEPPRPRGHPWKISLSNVRLDALRSCETGGYRLLGSEAGGSASLGGGLEIQLRGPVELQDLRLDFDNVELRSDEQSIARFARIEARIESDPFVMNQIEGRQLLRSFSGEIEIEGETSSLGFINEFLARAPWLDLESGPGRLETRLAFDRGLLRAGSRVLFRSDSVSVQYLDYVVRGSAELRGLVDGTTPTLTAAFREFSLREESTDDPHVVGEELSIRIDASSADLGETPDVRLRLDLPPSRVPDLTTYNRLVPDRAGVEIVGGTGILEAHLSISTADGRPGEAAADVLTEGIGSSRTHEEAHNGGSIELSSLDLVVDSGDLQVSGALTVTTDIDDVDTERRVLRISRAHITIADASIAREGEIVRSDWRGEIELDEGAVALAKPLRGRSRLRLEMTDIHPILVFFAEARPKIETVAKILRVEDIVGRARIELGADRLTIDGLDIRGERLEVEGRLCLGTDEKRGALHARAFGVGLSSWFDGADKRWTLLRPRRWYEQKLADSTCPSVSVDREIVRGSEGSR